MLFKAHPLIRPSKGQHFFKTVITVNPKIFCTYNYPCRRNSIKRRGGREEERECDSGRQKEQNGI